MGAEVYGYKKEVDFDEVNKLLNLAYDIELDL